MKSSCLQLEPPPHEGEEGGGGRRSREWLQEDRAKETASGLQNHLELRLGVSLNNNNNNNNKGNPSPRFLMTTLEGLMHTHKNIALPQGGTKSWFPEPPASCGFIHPWSLAARQQKAIFEHAHQKPMKPPPSSPPSTVPRTTPPPPPAVVGWPPVRAFRRNLGGNSQPPKPEMDGEKDTKRAKVTDEETMERRAEVKTTMFVKVNMEGIAVGRKINLKAHDSYESLSRALQRMFNNFLSINYGNNSKQEEEDEVPTPNYILLYEDHEGDRMLVGDVPWEMFLTSVKRLYIAHSPKTPPSDDGRAGEEQE